MIVEIINKSKNPLPSYATPGSAGMDIRASLGEPVVLKAGQRILIPTGLFVKIPEGYEIQIRPRSGLALKFGITVLNAPGTIDSDYRDEIGVILFNTSDRDFTVSPGERVAQMVLAEVPRIEWEPVNSFGTDTTNRGGGFGHTGIK